MVPCDRSSAVAALIRGGRPRLGTRGRLRERPFRKPVEGLPIRLIRKILLPFRPREIAIGDLASRSLPGFEVHVPQEHTTFAFIDVVRRDHSIAVRAEDHVTKHLFGDWLRFVRFLVLLRYVPRLRFTVAVVFGTVFVDFGTVFDD